MCGPPFANFQNEKMGFLNLPIYDAGSLVSPSFQLRNRGTQNPELHDHLSGFPTLDSSIQCCFILFSKVRVPAKHMAVYRSRTLANNEAFRHTVRPINIDVHPLYDCCLQRNGWTPPKSKSIPDVVPWTRWRRYLSNRPR